MFKSCTRKVILIASVVFTMLAIGVWHYCRAETIAKDAERVPEFFGLESFEYRLQDKLHSQDNDGCMSFGVITYWLADIHTLNCNVRENMLDRGAVESNKRISLEVARGDILGRMTLYPDSTSYKATIIYRKIK